MKKIPPKDFDLPSVLRKRRWTDDELLYSSFAGSIGLVKAMQAKGLIKPGKYKNDNGKRARAWTIEDVLLVSVVATISETSGLSLNAAVVLAEQLGREWLMDAALIPSTVAQFWQQWDALADDERSMIMDGGETDFVVRAKPVKSIILLDRFELLKSDDGVEQTLVGFLMNATSNKPQFLQPTQWAPVENETSRLIINCGRLTSGVWYFLSTNFEAVNDNSAEVLT